VVLLVVLSNQLVSHKGNWKSCYAW